eukprot:gene281-143_t
MVELIQNGAGSVLLQPIRDYVAIWQVDVSEELEGWLNQLENLVNEGDEGLACDFAEAALMMQGATNVYAKKVDMVQQLAFKILEAHASGKENDKEGAGYKSRRFVLHAEGCHILNGLPEEQADLDVSCAALLSGLVSSFAELQQAFLHNPDLQQQKFR